MEISKIQIKNFRLLKDFSLDLEDELSLIIGKNNTGKTSVLTALDKFINPSSRKAITLDDFNVGLKKELVEYLSGSKVLPNENDYQPLGIELKIYIEYTEQDDLSQVRLLIMSLDPSDNNIVLKFEYKIGHEQLLKLKGYYAEQSEKFNNNPELFLKEHLLDYFGSVQKKSLLFSDETVFIDLVKENIHLTNILSFDYISAKRSVTNKESDKTLSLQTAKIYKRTDDSEEQIDASDRFKQTLRNTDKELSTIYADMFDGLIKKVNQFGGVNPTDTKLKIASTLQHRDLLDGNTTVMYSHDSHDLPEHYNGLGYMNLISMIFDIEMVMGKFRRTLKEKPAAINLFFIEEPEAHTHPQMQYIFIKNIKSLLKENREREDGITIQLQTVITTHSSHIVSECDFNDIKYLRKNNSTYDVKAKNLKALQDEYKSGDDIEDAKLKRDFKFLKQYLTLNRAELFFADKAIFIEGDTERILVPAMMKKIDQEFSSPDETPLLSQNISLVEVGAYSQIFEKFIDFIGIKSLVITDIDSQYTQEIVDGQKTKKKTIKCKPSDPLANKTSNASLKFFFGDHDLDFYKNLSIDEKVLRKVDTQWIQDPDGYFLMVYQTEESRYHGRSFEDAFFSLNKALLGNDAENFPSLTKKHFNKFVDDADGDPYVFAEKAVNSKPTLAIEILLNSEKVGEHEFSNWQVPSYIKEGLLWLRKS
ncbi:ATP-dependent endonuclease [Colwellia sp. MT41]|uniref:ATP-dependent nuclease n=1 Tax=Colwellia sp. MT41 TaxID=58049 RepID=UPI0007177785|nr:ATP-dependent endonuclease [Colwellia sp. MT41]ALO34909.1 ATP-dependent endonuclease [Colwellia sp. MT41]